MSFGSWEREGDVKMGGECVVLGVVWEIISREGT